MPAHRLTADCIWNSFRSSGKRHLILTGGRGTGKTTLLSQLFPDPLPGLTTWAEPGKGVYLKENSSGKTVQVGEYDPALAGSENKMVLRKDGFPSFGVPALERCMVCGSPWVSVDEVGYLEAKCASYLHALDRLMEHKQLAAVVRKQQMHHLQALCRREDVFLVDLDDPFGAVGCVIMASGLGKRFGGNKLMAEFNGRPMLCQILDATEGIFRRRVVVTRHEDVARLCRARGISWVLHELPHRSDTVRLGLEEVGAVERCVFCAGDQPRLRWETVASLALSAANAPELIWRTAHGGVPAAPVLFPRWAFSELLSLPEGKGGGVVAKRYPAQVRQLSVADPYELRDVDCPEDLDQLQQ